MAEVTQMLLSQLLPPGSPEQPTPPWGAGEESDREALCSGKMKNHQMATFWKLSGAKKTKLVIGSHLLSDVRGGFQHCPQHGGLEVTKEKATQSCGRQNNNPVSAALAWGALLTAPGWPEACTHPFLV